MRVLFFDIDGTLIDTAGAGQAAMLGALRDRCGDKASTDGVSFGGRTDRGLAAELFANHQLPDNEATWQSFHDDYIAHLQQQLPQRPARVLPGARELIQNLVAQQTLGLALLTGNSPQAAYCKLQHLDLWHFFACGGFGDRHVHRNDVAQAALRAAQEKYQFNHATHPTWVIGDTPRDIECARAIGARCLAVATGHYSRQQLAECEADAVVDDLSDTNGLLELLLT